jgi:hypothetical protein
MTHNLNKDEIEFFYKILYKYEHESHAGYQDKEVEKMIGSKVTLDDVHKDSENITTEKKNCLQFPHRQNKCITILNHIRNAFAHGNIQSIENNTEFLIQDYSDKKVRSKCNMLGIINKKDFYELMDAMEKTRKGAKKTTKTNKV